MQITYVTTPPQTSPGEGKDLAKPASRHPGPLSEENGRVEVEFEVDQNLGGVRWTVVLRREGTRIARLVRTTRPPSGSFEARVVAANGPGADTFTARAVSPRSELCTARATFP